MIRKYPKREIRSGVQNTSFTSSGILERRAWPLILKYGHAQRGVYLQSHEPEVLEQVRLLYLAFIQTASAKHFISLYHRQDFGGLRSPVLCTAPMFPQYFELIELLS
jgi:hypothetical protein